MKLGRQALLAIAAVSMPACSNDSIVDTNRPDPDPIDVFVPDGIATPVPIGTQQAYSAVTASDVHTCALTVAGAAHCWGAHALGASWTQRYGWPIPVADGRTYTSIAAGTSHTCATTQSGSVYCWGREAPFGPLQAAASWQLPQRLETEEPVVGVVSGTSFACGLRNGAAVCWGQNLWGQLGTGSTAPIAAVAEVAGDLQFAKLGTMLGETACGLTPDQRLYCWGRADRGQLAGVETDACQAGPCAVAPQAIMPERRFLAVSAGINHVCAVTTEGQAFCWGANGEHNRLGSNAVAPGSESPTPVPVTSSERFADITVGADHTCALSVDTTAVCWGSNQYGQLGAGMGARWWYASHALGLFNNTPMGFRSISAGSYHTCGVSDAPNARIYCWGRRGEHLGMGNAS
jgi:alpha-tubulin suppressor-like RCC1 family protein